MKILLVSHRGLYSAHRSLIFICDLSYITNDINMASYSHDETSYTFARARSCFEKTEKRRS